MNWRRALTHLLLPGWWARYCFRRRDLLAIEAAIGLAEERHRGELRFVAEGPLSLWHLMRDQSPRQRAVELFSSLRVWDTEENSGILIYVQLADRKVEILADRGIAAKVPPAEWTVICRVMEHSFRCRQYREGALQAIRGASELLAAHFPAPAVNHANELPDRPVLL